MHRKRIFRRQSTWPTKVSCGAIVEIRLLVGLKDVGGQAWGFGAMEEAALVDAKLVRGTRYKSDAVKKKV